MARFFLATATGLLILGLASWAQAQSGRLVRVIWDVGAAEAGRPEYYAQAVRLAATDQPFQLPRRMRTGYEGFTLFRPAARGRRQRTGEVELRRGDRVVLYVTNYNAVSHRPGKGTVIVPEREIPLAAMALSAFAPALTAGSAASLFVSRHFRSTARLKDADVIYSSVVPTSCQTKTFKVRECVAATARSLQVVRTTLRSLTPDLGVMSALNAVAQEFPDDVWGIFDRERVARRLVTLLDDAVLGADGTRATYSEFISHVNAALEVIDGHTATVARNLYAIDLTCAIDSDIYAECGNAENGVAVLRQGYASVVEVLDGRQRDRTGIATGLAELRSGLALIEQHRERLSEDGESRSVATLEVSSNFPGGDRVVVEFPFVSRESNSTAQITREVLLASEYHYPPVFATVGVTVLRDFDFKVPILVEELIEARDGVVRHYGVASANTFRPVNASFLTHFKLGWPKRLYASVGTTADRNVFTNLMFGGSIYIPKWRAAVSIGGIRARGSTEEDILAAAKVLTSPVTGLAVGSAGGLGDTKEWAWRPFVGVSFNPFAR